MAPKQRVTCAVRRAHALFDAGAHKSQAASRPDGGLGPKKHESLINLPQGQAGAHDVKENDGAAAAK